MKRVLCMLIALSLIGCMASCEQNKPKSKDSIKLPTGEMSASTEFQKDFQMTHTATYSRGCEAGGGYYFVDGKHFVHFVDKESMKTTILCGKPQCKHTDETCNAFVPWTEHVTWYDGKLYYDGPNEKDGTWCLYSMDADGNNHKQVQVLWDPGSGISAMQLQFAIHHGLICFVSNEGKEVRVGKLGDRQEDTGVLLTNDGDSVEDSGFTGNEYQLWADGKAFYIMVAEKQDKYFKQVLYRYDPEAGEIKVVWKIPDKSEVGSWDLTGVAANGWYIKDDCLYYFLSGNGVYSYSFGEQKNKQLFSLPETDQKGTAVFDDTTIYINNKKDALSLYDYAGKSLGKLSYDSIFAGGGMVGESLGVQVSGTTKDTIFLVMNNFSRSSGSDVKIYACKRNAIGSEKPQPLFEQ